MELLSMAGFLALFRPEDSAFPSFFACAVSGILPGQVTGIELRIKFPSPWRARGLCLRWGPGARRASRFS
jgi:hypothetical protein